MGGNELSLEGAIRKALGNAQAILIVGGPSGCGKTTTSDAIVTAPEAFDLPLQAAPPLHRTDWKSLTRKHFVKGTIIVEFATNRLKEPGTEEQYRGFIQAMGSVVPIVQAYRAPMTKAQIIHRYFHRMTGKEYLHIGKWTTLLAYLRARPDDDFGISQWDALIADFAVPLAEWPPRPVR